MKRPVDNALIASTLANALGEPLTEARVQQFARYADELARFGSKLNLTAIHQAEQVLDKHFADSLRLSRSVPPGTLIDIGAGAGFPGLPLALVRADLDVTLVDSSKKKIGFLKALLVALDVHNARAVHSRLGAKPNLGLFDTAVARAVADLPDWLSLAKHHVRPGGLILAMFGRAPESAEIQRATADAGVRFVSASTYALPLSGDPRFLATFRI